MGLSTAERNKKKRERKKKAKEALKQQEQEEQKQQTQKKEKAAADDDNTADTTAISEEEEQNSALPHVEIEYVAEDLLHSNDQVQDDLLLEQLKRFQAKSSVVSVVRDNNDDNDGRTRSRDDDDDDEEDDNRRRRNDNDEDDDDEQYHKSKQNWNLSKRKLREQLRPTVAELKRRVTRPDLVEAHDVTAADPDFLIYLKATPGTVPVPRHWGRKRKYLQGKRGFEKPPFQLPDFILKTGITEVRDTVAEAEANMSAKQKNRSRVAPKMGAIDVDYSTLHAAFFKYQTKPTNLTKFGDMYYEGKEMEVDIDKKSTGILSPRLREALGMTSETSPPPWLLNMQRYGPPPAYPGLKVPGLNAPLPTEDCSYGFHPGGWGKPPVDPYGRPLYGGNPFDPPGSATAAEKATETLVTSDGKMIGKTPWGDLPTGMVEGVDAEESGEEDEEEEEGDDMEDSEEEEEEEEGEAVAPQPEEGQQSILPPPPTSANPFMTAPANLRKQAESAGQDTPVPPPPKALYQVLEPTRPAAATGSRQAVFASERTYAIPSAEDAAGVESVISKALPTTEESNKNNKRKRNGGDDDDEEDDETDLGKNFKF